MQLAGAAILALVIASVFTGLELITTSYSRTYFVFSSPRYKAFYIYSSIYGIVALILVFSTNALSLPKVTGISNPWIEAAIIGVSTKAFLHIRLFSVPASIPGGDPIPFGVETLVQIFEPTLLNTIESDETDGLHRFLDLRVSKYKDANDVQNRIMQNLPRRMDQKQRIAFKNDLEQKLKEPDGPIFAAMVLYLSLMGRHNLDRVFPS